MFRLRFNIIYFNLSLGNVYDAMEILRIEMAQIPFWHDKNIELKMMTRPLVVMKFNAIRIQHEIRSYF